MVDYFYNEKPLIVNPELAQIVGLNEAIILHQIHYWVVINNKNGHNCRDGFYWTYNTYREWQEQFPFWSLRTIKTVIKNLERKGLLITSNFNKMKTDRTKWYRIDYDACTMHSADVALSKCNVVTMESADIAQPIPETNTETTTEINSTVEKPDDVALFISKLPYWKWGNGDGAWLADFRLEFRSLSTEDIKACRDYHSGKKKLPDKGIWKNRLRNWMKNKRSDNGNNRNNLPNADELDRQAAVRGV